MIHLGTETREARPLDIIGKKAEPPATARRRELV